MAIPKSGCYPGHDRRYRCLFSHLLCMALCFKAEMSTTTTDEQIRRADEENMIVVKEV